MGEHGKKMITGIRGARQREGKRFTVGERKRQGIGALRGLGKTRTGLRTVMAGKA
jgi:hypothetical protein